MCTIVRFVISFAPNDMFVRVLPFMIAYMQGSFVDVPHSKRRGSSGGTFGDAGSPSTSTQRSRRIGSGGMDDGMVDSIDIAGMDDQFGLGAPPTKVKLMQDEVV